MIYLTTGANGAGKTLNTLKWVRDQSLKENRPVYYNGRFDMVADFGWIKFEFKDWLSLPDGAILLVDECHNDMPVRGNGSLVPEPIRMLAEHRRRGFDFYLITQHPQNIDLFVRRLIGPPGWHRHLKRTFGVDMVSCLEWSAVNPGCEKAGSGKDAKVTMIPFPKEVYGWYNSAMLHTGKKSVPKQLYFIAAALVLIPALGYFAFKRVTAPSAGLAAITAPVKTQTFAVTPNRNMQGDKVPLTPAEYASSFTPRVDGFPSSAPRYDALSMPNQAPKPAACIEGRRPGSKVTTCECWTQQATRLNVPAATCKQIANGGWFDDTLQALNSKSEGAAPAAIKTSQIGSNAPSMVAVNLSPVLDSAEARSTIARDVDVMNFMRKRQAVR